jgi:hypothetical protein
MDIDDPAQYLKQPPTSEEHALSALVDLHGAEPVPFRMLAAIAVRLHRVTEWIATRTQVEARMKRLTRLGAATLAANLALMVTYAAHRLEASGAAEEHAANLERVYEERRETMQRAIDGLRDEIRYLQRRIDKITGSEDHDSDVVIVKHP